MFGTIVKIVHENAQSSHRELENIFKDHVFNASQCLENSFSCKYRGKKIPSTHINAFIPSFFGMDACIEEVLSRYCKSVVGIDTKQTYSAVLSFRPELKNHLHSDIIGAFHAFHTIRNVLAHSVNPEKRYAKFVFKNHQSDIKKLFDRCTEGMNIMAAALYSVKMEQNKVSESMSSGVEAVRNLGIKL